MIKRKRVLAAKLESVVGTAEELTAADAAMNIYDAMIQPDIEFEERPGQGTLSPEPGVPGPRGGTATFSVEWHGSGTAEDTGGESVPAWASVFLPCCGLVSTSGAKNVFTPITGVPAAAAYGQRTCTIATYVDGTKRMLAGCMGDAVFRFVAGKVVKVDFTFTGVWQAPTTTAILEPTYPTVLPLRMASAGLAITEDSACKISEFTVSLNNNVVLREDVNGASGFISAMITERLIRGEFDPEAVAASNTSTHANWLTSTEQQVDWSLGAGSDGNTVAFDIPKAQFRNLQEGDRNGRVTNQIEFQANRDADTGDDEFQITFT